MRAREAHCEACPYEYTASTRRPHGQVTRGVASQFRAATSASSELAVASIFVMSQPVSQRCRGFEELATVCHGDLTVQERLFYIQKRLLARCGNFFCAVGEEGRELGLGAQQVV